MSDWDWITIEGAVGELPVRILPNRRAEFLDYVEGVMIDYELSTDDALNPGDLCILRAEIKDAQTDHQPAGIQIDVLDVEFLQRAEVNDSKTEEMMIHLEEAKKRHKREKEEAQCDNCATIGSSTRLSVETKIGDRDLHYCATCGRLLSADEYEQWKSMNH